MDASQALHLKNCLVTELLLHLMESESAYEVKNKINNAYLKDISKP